MKKISKVISGMQIAQQNAMLKESSQEDFKKIFAGYILKCYRLNGEPEPDPKAFTEIVDELFEFLQKTWPGVRLDLIWHTLKQGMAKQGGGYLKITYPVLANWLRYHRVMKTPDDYAAVPDYTPSLNEQAESVLAGLKAYRERVARGEYKPKGRES